MNRLNAFQCRICEPYIEKNSVLDLDLCYLLMHSVNRFQNAHKAIDVINILTDRRSKHFCSQRKGSAVSFCYLLTALMRYVVKYFFHFYRFCFSIKPATNFPDIKEGGTPGPGTDNCPVKNRFFTFLLFKLGLRNAVCIKVLANPYALPLYEL